MLSRKFSFTAPRLFVPHFNHSVGRYVTSDADFRDALKQASEQAYDNTGIEHNYVPVEPREVMKNLRSEEGLAEQEKAKVDAGN